MNNIPKIIHYCWFGKNEKSDKLKKCIKSWSDKTDYKIIEWNEENFNINEHPYVKEAYTQKKWAFVSDYVRLKVLFEFGGIYLDTDMELKNNLDIFLKNNMFLGFMYDCNLSAGIIGCRPKCQTIKHLLMKYDDLILDKSPNNDLFTRFFIERGLKLNNREQLIGEVKIYPKEFFTYNSFKKNLPYAIHHFEDSWKAKNKIKEVIKNIVFYLLGDILFYKISNKLAVKKSPFYSIYLKDKEEEK